MAISFTCACGKALRARDDQAGKKTRCRQCGAILAIPVPEYAPDFDDGSAYVLREPDPRPMPARPAPVRHDPIPTARVAPGPPSPGWSPAVEPAVAGPVGSISLLEYAYLVLVFTLLPLVVSLLGAEDRVDIKERIERTIRRASPEQARRAREILAKESGSVDELFAVLPEGKIEGAHLPRDTMAHWVYAGIATGTFLILTSLFFTVERVNPLSLFLVGLFTGTIGIVFLLIAQLLVPTYGGKGIFGSNIAISALAFTVGVGLWEELTKAIPLFYYFKKYEGMGWRGACLWGLASGIGFGVSEGVLYSSKSYNGITGADMYFVRFISCVALHAMWAASVGIAIARNVEEYDRLEGKAAFARFMLRVLAVPMILHGFYDAFLSEEMSGWALFVALLSFGWLVMHIELARLSHPHAGTVRRAFAY